MTVAFDTAIEPPAALGEIPEFPGLERRLTGEYNSMCYSFAHYMGTPGPFVPEINALATNVANNAQAAHERAMAAQAAAGSAAGESDAAMAYRNQAGHYATTAGQKADVATAAQEEATRQAGISTAQAVLSNQAREQTELARNDVLDAKTETIAARDKTREYRDQAAVFASGQLKATSASNVTPGAGAKAFTIDPSRSFVPGMYLVATSTGAPGTQMSGPVQSYDPTTGALVIAVDTFSGAAPRSDWAIGVAAKGASGMAQQVVTGDTVAVPGVIYIFTSATATLTLPTAGLSNDSRIGVRLAAPVSYEQVIDFGGIPYLKQPAGQRYIDMKGLSLDIQYNTAQGTWV